MFGLIILAILGWLTYERAHGNLREAGAYVSFGCIAMIFIWHLPVIIFQVLTTMFIVCIGFAFIEDM